MFFGYTYTADELQVQVQDVFGSLVLAVGDSTLCERRAGVCVYGRLCVIIIILLYSTGSLYDL